MPLRPINRPRRPWNKGLLIGQKKPLEPKHVWSIRVRLEVARSRRDLCIFTRPLCSVLRGGPKMGVSIYLRSYFQLMTNQGGPADKDRYLDSHHKMRDPVGVWLLASLSNPVFL
jgi:hypothetical protein